MIRITSTKLDEQHLLNFCRPIWGNEKINAPSLEDDKATLSSQIGNIAYIVDRSIEGDPSNEHIIDNHEGIKLWSRAIKMGESHRYKIN